MPHRPKHIAEYIALRCIAGLVQSLPYRCALSVGWFNAWLAFQLAGFRVEEAKTRIRQVLGDALPQKKIDEIAWFSWRNFIFSVVETLRLERMSLDWLDPLYSDQQAIEKLSAHANTGKGAVIATWHMGSWEMAAVRVYLNRIPVFSIAATQKNPLTDQYLNHIRKAPGIERIARGSGTMRDVLRKLKAGGCLAILPDVRAPRSGVQVPFLGGQANIGEGMARFAMQAKIPIIPVTIQRQGWARHSMFAHELIWPDATLGKKDDTRRMTHAVFAIIDKAVRDHPDQWFWFNKRWILDPVPDQ